MASPSPLLVDNESVATPPLYLYGARRTAASIGLGIALFVSLMDTTIVAVALPEIGGQLQGYDRTGWVITAYLITYVAFLPIFSKVAAITSPKYVLLNACIIFVAFSGACGGANTLIELIVFRALQGVGGSALWSCSIMTFSTAVPPDVAHKYMTIPGSMYAIASVLGPILGGVISERTNWAWIFWINLPLGGISTILIATSMHAPGLKTLQWSIIRRRIDWLGAFLLLTCLLLLVVALQLGGGPDFTWSDRTVLSTLIVAVALLPVLLWVETRSKEPIMPLPLFATHRNIALNLVSTIGVGAGFFATVIYLPQRMQLVDGLSAEAAGIRMLPMLCTAGFIGAATSPLIARTGSYRPLYLISLTVAAVIGGLLSRLGTSTNLSQQYALEVIMGCAAGIALAVTTITFQYAVPDPDVPVALGYCSTARMLGAGLGISIGSTIINSLVRHRLKAVPGLSPSLINAIMKAPDSVTPTLAPDIASLIHEAYADGYRWIFITVAIWFSFALIPGIFLLHVPVPTRVESAPVPAEVHRLDALPVEGSSSPKITSDSVKDM